MLCIRIYKNISSVHNEASDIVQIQRSNYHLINESNKNLASKNQPSTSILVFILIDKIHNLKLLLYSALAL